MRHDGFIVPVLLACALAGGCKVVDERTRADAEQAPAGDGGQMVADYLTTLDRLGNGGVAEQAEILEAVRTAYLADPSTHNRLRYAFVLGVPGHVATDSAGARRLLGEALAAPEALLDSERALAELMLRDIDVRIALAEEIAHLRSDTTAEEHDHVATLNRRLQQETAEKERLRRELEEALKKLEAIATLEGSGRRNP
jgi:cell division septum initiation protein DivIVA